MVSRLSSEEENPKLIFESQDYRNRTCLLIIERFPFVLLDILSFHRKFPEEFVIFLILLKVLLKVRIEVNIFGI